ncbi:MAG: 5-deoxy-glucuronate isomerase [Kineosporiaceae bacterium]|nr:5-deoxy-glucuronate isomerase [Aeromicrobium sp.]
MNRYVLRKGESSTPPFALDISPKSAGWKFSGLRLLELGPGESQSFDSVDAEILVLSLAGSAHVDVDGEKFTLIGRDSVFNGISDVVYVPRDAHCIISSDNGGRFALPSARCENRLAPAYLRAADVPVEMRGAGQVSRQVNNFGVPGVLDADRLIACEVLTPGGNWSSYPPHKHDEERVGEARLEEIYYFEVASGPQGPGIGYQRVYGHAGADIDVTAEVRDGDVVLVPHGWHGPSIAAPGYDLYYLNVMAGPGEERSWLICDDPQHAWIRDTWSGQDIDSRLPFGTVPFGSGEGQR